MADYGIQCKHSLFIISTLYFGFFIKGMVMDSFTAKNSWQISKKSIL